MRIAFFGSFYPHTQKAANSSTGIAILLSIRPDVEIIHLFVPQDAYLPTTINAAKVAFRPAWRHDDLISLIKTTVGLVRISRAVDGYLFNIYMTSFGRTFLVNGFGLLIAPLVAMLTRKPVVVYMHNFYSTQDASRLGYAPNLVVQAVVRLLEFVLLQRTHIVVPLESQRDILSRTYHLEVDAIFLPYIETVHALLLGGGAAGWTDSEPGSPARILLFGHWGPQKDLPRVRRILTELIKENPGIRVTIAGDLNVNFPDYARAIAHEPQHGAGDGITFLGRVPEDDLRRLVQSHDLLILPYSATGGYSGAMNTAAPWGIAIAAYDQPQLRETAKLLGVDATFIQFDSDEAIKSGILSALQSLRRPATLQLTQRRAIELSQSALTRLLVAFKNPFLREP